MLLFPKQTKFTKSYSRKKIKANYKQPDFANLGAFCIIAKESGRITGRQLDSLRRFLRRKLRKHARFWVKIFPNTPITKKPVGARLGKGKGPVKYWACSVRPGQILFEIRGCDSFLAKSSVLSATLKLPLKTLFFCKNSRWIL
jgi:large subunit ribosomal protein L16